MRKLSCVLVTFFVCMFSFIFNVDAKYEYTLVKEYELGENDSIPDLLETENAYYVISPITKEIKVFDKDGEEKSSLKLDSTPCTFFKINGEDYILFIDDSKYSIEVAKFNSDSTVGESQIIEVKNSGFELSSSFYIEGDDYIYFLSGDFLYFKIAKDLSGGEVVVFNAIPDEDKVYLNDFIEVNKLGVAIEPYEDGLIYRDLGNDLLGFYDEKVVWTIEMEQSQSQVAVSAYDKKIFIFQIFEYRLAELIVLKDDGTVLARHDFTKFIDKFFTPEGNPRYMIITPEIYGIENGFFLSYSLKWPTSYNSSLKSNNDINTDENQGSENNYKGASDTRPYAEGYMMLFNEASDEELKEENVPETLDEISVYMISLIGSVIVLLALTQRRNHA